MAQRTLFLILVIILGFVGWQTVLKVHSRSKLVKEISSLEKEIEQLEGKNLELVDLMDYVKSDAFLEKEARMRFNLAKPGEKMLVIIPPDNQGKEEIKKENSKEDENFPNPQKWWRYFVD